MNPKEKRPPVLWGPLHDRLLLNLVTNWANYHTLWEWLDLKLETDSLTSLSVTYWGCKFVYFDDHHTSLILLLFYFKYQQFRFLGPTTYLTQKISWRCLQSWFDTGKREEEVVEMDSCCSSVDVGHSPSRHIPLTSGSRSQTWRCCCIENMTECYNLTSSLLHCWFSSSCLLHRGCAFSLTLIII